MALPAILSNRPLLVRNADYALIALAASLPWSTSLTAILSVVWLIAAIPTLNVATLRRDALSAAGGLPLLLVMLGVLGMAWADVTFAERAKGIDSFAKLLFIPLLLSYGRASERGTAVIWAYGVSCTVLLIASWAMVVWPQIVLFSREAGVPAKNAPTQSGEFATCIFVLMFLARDYALRRAWLPFAAICAVMLAMLANIIFVATGRTALVVMLVLLAVFALRMLSVKGIAAVAAATVLIGAIGWFSSPYLRARTEGVLIEIRNYQTSDERNSSGERLAFARKSVDFIAEAPVIGHGTGSIPSLFRRAAQGQGADGSATTNPHNQTFAVGIQLGVVGIIVLWAMWLAHGLLFRAPTFAAWTGLVLVVQNVVGSLFNSHLFDFTQGWTYVIGVGVAGGLVLKARGPA